LPQKYFCDNAKKNIEYCAFDYHHKNPMAKESDISRSERKSRKRALEAAIPDLPGDIEVDSLAQKPSKRKRNGEGDGETVNGESNSKKIKKDASSKWNAGSELGEKEAIIQMEKNSKKNIESATDPETPIHTAVQDEEATKPKKSKKERKAERRAKEAATGNKEVNDGGAIKTVLEAGEQPLKEEADTGNTKSKKNNRNRDKKRKGGLPSGDTAGYVGNKNDKAVRFIVFVGKTSL
jgi:nucleolar protein 6